MSTKITELPDEDLHMEESYEPKYSKASLKQEQDLEPETEEKEQKLFSKSNIMVLILLIIVSYEPVQRLISTVLPGSPYKFLIQGVGLFIIYYLVTKFGSDYLTL
jgi:hypothetical protein